MIRSIRIHHKWFAILVALLTCVHFGTVLGASCLCNADIHNGCRSGECDGSDSPCGTECPCPVCCTQDKPRETSGDNPALNTVVTSNLSHETVGPAAGIIVSTAEQPYLAGELFSKAPVLPGNSIHRTLCVFLI